MKKRTIGIIGGGASGMVAAIAAARQGAEVTVFERNDRVGKKILITGNGKCNLGNQNMTKDKYYGSDIERIMSFLSRFDTDDTVSFFRGLGLMIKCRNGGLYPASEQASVVLDVLRMEMGDLGIRIVTQCKINHISSQDNKIIISDGTKEAVFDRVIIACGGKAAPGTGSDGSGHKLAKQIGHSLIPTVPALVQLKCAEDYFKSVAGVRTDAEVTLWKEEECIAGDRGELQLTEYGISGIPVFQISRVAGYLLREQKQAEIHINLLPDYDEEDMERLYAARCILQGDRTVEEFFTGMLNKKIMQLFVKMSGLKGSTPVKEADESAVRNVLSLCRQWNVTVTAANSYENAQVCAGGVPLSEVTKDLESCRMPGVYFAGEVLDVDGKCGGYNLQWAWCSGYLAGTAAGSGDR